MKVLDVNTQRLAEILVSLGKQKFRAKQLRHAILHQGAKTFDGVTTLSKTDREGLASSFKLRAGEVKAESVAQDGTVKWLVDVPKSSKPAITNAADTVVVNNLPVKPGASAQGTAARPSMQMEMVFIPEFPDRRRTRGRGTLCVSSQAGCSLACSFCHTGTQQLLGNASAGDILEQVLTARERITALNSSQASNNDGKLPQQLPLLSHIVFMGQGEPLLNWSNVKTAIETLTAPGDVGLGMAPRRITISTAGVAPLIPRVATETPGVRLALSLHAPEDALRSRIMGINNSWPLDQVMGACGQYLTTRMAQLAQARAEAQAAFEDDDDDDDDDPSRPPTLYTGDRHNSSRRVRITFEYVMLRGVNDSRKHALQLVDMLRSKLVAPEAVQLPALSSSGQGPAVRLSGPSHDAARPHGGRATSSAPLSLSKHAHVNLIPFNPWPGSQYECSHLQDIRTFQTVLEDAGIMCTIRRSRGQDILGACGQLRSSEESKAARRKTTQATG